MAEKNPSQMLQELNTSKILSGMSVWASALVVEMSTELAQNPRDPHFSLRDITELERIYEHYMS